MSSTLMYAARSRSTANTRPQVVFPAAGPPVMLSSCIGRWVAQFARRPQVYVTRSQKPLALAKSRRGAGMNIKQRLPRWAVVLGVAAALATGCGDGEPSSARTDATAESTSGYRTPEERVPSGPGN